MNKFYIITNKLKDPDFARTHEIADYLKGRGAECICQGDSRPSEEQEDYLYTNADDIPEDTDAIIVLGGDGTLIRAARDVRGTDIPLLGVNIGTLGFLTDADMTSVYNTLDCCIADNHIIDKRMMLQGEVYRNDELIYENTALNDIVINRCGTLRVIDFDVYVNDEYLNSYTADGVIVSTATGSTAYSLSAGGPIIQPNAKLIMITPICPHTLNKRSIIFGDDDEIVIKMGNNKGTEEERVATFDGEMVCKMITGDKIVIRKASIVTDLIKTNKMSFLQRIRNKM
jgi:NAD+ kinase